MSANTIVGKLKRLNGELKVFGWMAGVFVLAYFLPLSNPKVTNAIQEAFKLLQWYARNHTLACVVPALFIAGAVITFLSQASVMRYLGPKSNKALAYGLAAGTSTELVERRLKWNEQSKGVIVMKGVCGVLVLLGGVWLIYSAP